MKEPMQSEDAAGRLNLPVNLLVEGRPCLVVGGGAVAHRKVSSLLDAGARVRVVSPELCDDLRARVQAGEAEHVERRFEPADVAGMRLVFAATNDRTVNRAVLEAARAARVFCCCVDANWPDADFVTPATLRRDGLTVAVSTGGRSCRQARLVKDTLDRHIRTLETAELLVLGTSHEELPLERREAIQPVGARLASAGAMLMQVWGIHEFMLLTTCNRVELVAVASSAAGASGLLERIMGLEGLREGEWYRRTRYAAFEHLALVTAGMRSQAPGEYHVAAQVKSALDAALRNGWAGSMLRGWVAAALHISKHVKNEVTPLLHPMEVEDVSVAYAAEAKGEDWSGHTVMVLGTGMVGRTLVERALERKARCVWGYHMNRPELDAAWQERVRLISLNEMKDALSPCDIVFCAMEAAGAVLHPAHAPFFDQERRVMIVDLGVPRNVHPALLPLLPEADLVNLDRLKSWAARTYGHLDRALATSHAIVEQHRNEYESLINRLQGRNPTQ